MNWNIEWMDIFFKNDQEFEENCERGKVKDILEKIAAVIKEIDPDILSIEEGPSSIEKISLFIDNFLNSSFLPFGYFIYIFYLFVNIMILYYYYYYL